MMWPLLKFVMPPFLGYAMFSTMTSLVVITSPTWIFGQFCGFIGLLLVCGITYVWAHI